MRGVSASAGRAPVRDPQLLAKVQRKHQLLEEVPRDILRQALARPAALVFNHKLKHVPARGELHHDGQVLWRQEDLAELHQSGRASVGHRSALNPC